MSTLSSNNYSDFNYPSLSRKDLMSLDTIKPYDFPKRKIGKINTKRDWSTNLYNLDIEKSVANKIKLLNNKIDFINKLDDIEKSQPKKERLLKKPDFCLNISDIEKTSSNMLKIKTNRHTNPLNPIYKLPAHKEIIPPPNKFIRDNLDISDIEKAQPRKLFPLETRPVKNYISDNFRKKFLERKIFYDSYKYDDLKASHKKFGRNTNPLDPDYGPHYGGAIEGAKPFIPIYKFNINNERNFHSNLDILGSSAGSKNYFSKFKFDNKERFDTSDILGASGGSKKYGIVSKRCTNPLCPDYQYIGNSENVDLFGNKINTSKSTSNIEIHKENNDKKKIDITNINNKEPFYNLQRRLRINRSCEEIEQKLPLLSKINDNNIYLNRCSSNKNFNNRYVMKNNKSIFSQNQKDDYKAISVEDFSIYPLQ